MFLYRRFRKFLGEAGSSMALHSTMQICKLVQCTVPTPYTLYVAGLIHLPSPSDFFLSGMIGKSMNRRTILFPSALLFHIFLIPAIAQDTLTYYHQAVVVTANRAATQSLYVGRSIDVIGGEEIRQLGTMSIEDALRNGSDISVQSRGPFGVQTDLSIRGSLFSQNCVLLNGIPLNDPQTAHHDFDIPIPTTTLERIEVLKGPGSAQYGSSAYGGVINIIMQEPQATAASSRMSAGNYGLLEGAGTVDIATPYVRTSNAVEYRRSEGYRYDTDFSIGNLTSNTTFHFPFGTYSLLGGFGKKEFGALDFYSPGKHVPSKEWTETGFLSLSTSLASGSLQLAPRVYYRSHLDRFMYDIRTPDRYVNSHRTRVVGGELVSQYSVADNLIVVSGAEANGNTIVSNALGNHHQEQFAAYISSHYIAENALVLDGGARADYFSAYGWQFSPSIGTSYLLSSRGKVYVSIGRSFRAPSYTDLYYSDPSTEGNANLRPEIGWSYESGIDYFFDDRHRATLTTFVRDQSNLIDYVQYTRTDISHAVNFTSAKTAGFEMSVEWHPLHRESEMENTSAIFFRRLRTSYGYLDSQIDRGNVFSSRYAFVHPRHRICANTEVTLPYATLLAVNFSYNSKPDRGHYTLLEAQLSKAIASISVYVKGTNLLNESYEEIAGVPLPGRWIWAGAEYRLL